MKRIKKILSIFFSTVLLCTQSTVIGASTFNTDAADPDPLKIYKERLLGLNGELGTDYVIRSDGTLSYEEMVRFYQDMSIKEFDRYIYSLHRSDLAHPVPEIPEEKAIEQYKNMEIYGSYEEIEETEAFGEETEAFGIGGETPYAAATLKRQKFFYEGWEPRYFKVVFTLGTNVNGRKCYTGIKGMKYHSKTYPFYTIEGYGISFSKYYRKADLAFRSYRFLSPGLMDAHIYHLFCTFKVNGGAVYATTNL